MNAFGNAVRAEQISGKTFNNATTLATTGNPCLDLFGAAGNRNVNLAREFDLAHAHNAELAFRIALWTRDIRGGAGERQTFRNLLLHFEKHYQDKLLLILPKIPEYGRWDDLLFFTEDRVEKAAFNLIQQALVDRNGLCAKWMPRKGIIADRLRNHLGLTPRAYRKLLVGLTKVVESQMCANQWKEIVFDHVPSVASARYQKAFGRHAPEEYTAYKQGLVKVKEDGTTERKVNAGAVYPYDVIKSIDKGDRAVAEAQWMALPNMLGDEMILPIVDVSGSMDSWSYYDQRAKGSKVKNLNVSPMDIAVSLGLYVANKQTGPFSGLFMTFSTRPEIQHLTGSIVNQYNQIKRSHWDMSTNIEGAFDAILNLARQNAVPAADMPKILLILSDMEFDACARDRSGSRITNYENARIMFERAGYQLPKVVFWTINGRADNNPVSQHTSGTALVSGFSPSIFKSVVKADFENYTPEAVMLDVIMNPRYDIAGVTTSETSE